MKQSYKFLVPFAVAFSLLSLSSCDNNDEGFLLGGQSNGQGSGTNAPVPSHIATRMEVPALKSGNTFVSHWTMQGRDSVMTYCLEFDPTANHSRWIAFRFDTKTRPKGTGRTEAWADDPLLPRNMQIGTSYFGGGYSRGHLCASYDRQYSEEANAQTFYMSNMSPQISNFNAGIWQKLEAYVQNIGRDASFADTLYVVKGGTIAEGQINTRITRPNGLQVVVPKYYFMALLKAKNHTHSGIAFLLEHRNYTTTGESPYTPYAISIDELEEKTGIDFFPNLPDLVEEVVESTFIPSAWQLK